ncbi:hypothetical protein Lal_00037554 [Lupinus albus]|nr:hypothetical protein Lal_00037554 [Lupinus albus]
MNVMISALKKCHTLLQIVDKEDVSEELMCVVVQVFKEQIILTVLSPLKKVGWDLTNFSIWKVLDELALFSGFTCWKTVVYFELPKAYAANIYNKRPPHQQQHYDPPSSSTYNPGWRNQAPFQNNNVGQNRSSYVPPPIQQQRHQMINTTAPTEPSLEELVRQMTMQNMQFQQETRAAIQRQESSIQNLTTQMGHMATSLNTLQSLNSDNFCIDEFLNIDIDIDVPCTSLYTCHACIDSELCDSCIDEFLNIVVDSPVTHSHCTNPNDAGIRQQSDLFVQVQAATKPRFATFFPSVLQAPDWRPPFDLECDIAVYALGIVLASYEFDFLPP